MTLQEANAARRSVRTYKEEPLSEEAVRTLSEKIDEVNANGGLHIQLVVNEPKAFQGRLAKYGKFSGVGNYLVMAGRKSDDLDERLGYYGESIVLLAQTLGLNTCWVGLTFSKVPGTYTLAEGETIRAYIALGYGATEGATHKIKTPEQVSNIGISTPDWFRKGFIAALHAPTAVNQQKFFFEYSPAQDGQKASVAARRSFSLIGFTQMDLGIAKCHFEIGAGKVNFDWKNV